MNHMFRSKNAMFAQNQRFDPSPAENSSHAEPRLSFGISTTANVLRTVSSLQSPPKSGFFPPHKLCSQLLLFGKSVWKPNHGLVYVKHFTL